LQMNFLCFNAFRNVVLLLVSCLFCRAACLQSQESDLTPLALEKPKSSLWRHVLIGAVSGAAAGFVTDVSCYPIEAIKTKLQSGHQHNHDPKVSILSWSKSLKSLFSGVEVSGHTADLH
jgi:hypothetical protein